MTDTERVIRELVHANPAPDPKALHRSRPDANQMLTMARQSGHRGDVRPRTNVRKGWMVAVASFLIVVGLGTALTWLLTTSTVEPSETTNPVALDAVAATEQWLEASNRGDVARMMALSSPTSRDTADERLYEWLAGLAREGMPVEVTACVALDATERSAAVECQVRLGDRVAVELGMSEVVAPFLYSEGLVSWLPYRGADISQVNRAYSNYLRQYHPVEYEEACLASAYEPGSVVSSAGLTLTGECAELAAPLANEVVQWIRDGRPPPGE